MKTTTGSRGFFLKSVFVLLYTAAIACACEAATTATFTPTGTATFTNTPTRTAIVSSIWRVNAGGPLYPDSWGNTWAADTNFNNGTGHCVTMTVANTIDSVLYQCERYGSPFTYGFNVPAGNYQVTLKFADLFWEAAGERVFDVFINGALVLDNFDIISDSGSAFTAVSKVFNNIAPVSGAIALQFGPASVDNAQVCAIQINPMPPAPTPTKTPCLPTTINPYIRVNEGIWSQSSVTVFMGTAVNLGPQPLTGGTWKWTGPAGFVANSREISNIPLTYGVNTYTVVHTNSCGGQNSVTFTVTVLVPVITEAVGGCAAAITTDGVMNESEWDSAAWNSISKICEGTNPGNVSGNFKLLWDTKNLYAGIAINDAYLNATQVACANYNDSAVEMYLDMANDHGAQSYPGSVGDFHFMISYDCLQFCLNAAVAMAPSGMKYASTHDAGGYVMEVKIPWVLLGVVPAVGDTYQFDLQVDFNNGTSERVGQLVWNGDANNWKSSANFGNVRLGYCPGPPLKESFHVFPNPVNPKQSQARFNYNIENESEISIEIFTISGSRVKTVLNKVIKPAGQHNEDAWDSKNESGKEVLSGVYLCVLEVKDRVTGGTTRLVKKMAVLR